MEENFILTRARIHYEKHICSHQECQVPDGFNLAISFARMQEDIRIDAVRMILLALTSPPNCDNTLNIDAGPRVSKRKLDRRILDGANCTTTYAMRGQRICRDAFIAITQISSASLQSHGYDVATNEMFSRYHPDRSKSRKGKLGPSSTSIIAFLKRYANLNGLLCPTGKGNTEDECVVVLPSDTTKKQVHEKFVLEYPQLMQAACENTNTTYEISSIPTEYSNFVSIWNKHCKWIKIANPGTDFCDACTRMRNAKEFCEDDFAKQKLQETIDNHLNYAKSEIDYLRQKRIESKTPSSKVVHVIIDFAEKVLIPSLVNQPGQLHFITGLKIDLFAVSCGNTGKNYVFCLPEGHWPGQKSANEVISMLFHILMQLKNKYQDSLPPRLIIHCDNCAGQNKNRFLLWFCSWLTETKMFQDVELDFLVAGHTKNECDGAFGCIKKRLRRTNVRDPESMRNLVDESSSSAVSVRASEISWIKWKEYLGKHYMIPAKFKITAYHQFKFIRGPNTKKGELYARCLSTSDEWRVFSLLKKEFMMDGIENVPHSEIFSKYASQIPNLSELKVIKDLSRKDYLIKNVCERYYENDALFKEKFFKE